MKRQGKGLGGLKTVFLKISEVKPVPEKCQTAKTCIYRRKIVNLVSFCFHPVPFKGPASKGTQADLIKKRLSAIFPYWDQNVSGKAHVHGRKFPPFEKAP